MAEARRREAWWHTATLMATVMNTCSMGKVRQVTPRELHPMENRKPRLTLRGKQLTILRDVFCKRDQK